MNKLARILLLLIIGMISLPVLGQTNGLPIATKVPPGYKPSLSSKWDEQGMWMQMGEAESDIKRSPMLLRDSDIARHVASTACHIAGEYCNDLRVYTVKHPQFNASMAPNGTMIVHTGLLMRVTSTDELAAVLGHELAHYTQAHSLRRFRAAKNRMTVGSLVSLGLAAGGIDGGGLPEIFALASVMGFTRSQESEADVLGTHFIARSGFAPGAAAMVWARVSEEEQRATVKYPKGSPFLSSHPSSTSRERKLVKISQDLEPSTTRPHERHEDPFVAALQQDYAELMDLQIKQGDYGRLMTMLDRHDDMGIEAADVAFYRGQAWRQRRGAGDHEKAIAEYRKAIMGADPNVDAYRELGYLLLKHDEPELAHEALTKYLELRPDASDKEMILFYLEGSW